MGEANANHPFIMWATCYLWLVSLVSIVWSVTLLFISDSQECLSQPTQLTLEAVYRKKAGSLSAQISNYLVLTQTDLVVAVTLLSGIMMVPSNVLLLKILSSERKIESKLKIWCCPLWTSMMWVIIVDVIGSILCIHRLAHCGANTAVVMSAAMRKYRSNVQLKSFIDNVQWFFKCCGFKSYRDWLNHDWYDKVREYEWQSNLAESPKSDSVPLSCCKSGSCVPNYLTELGPYSINTAGCASSVFYAVISCLWAHLLVFVSVVGVELLIIKLISRHKMESSSDGTRELMSLNRRFATSSSSNHLGSRESDRTELLTKE